MVAANENQPKELSASFRVVRGVELTKEPAMTPSFLEMESSPEEQSMALQQDTEESNEVYSTSFRGSSTISPPPPPPPGPTKKNKSVQFASSEQGGVVHHIVPAVTEDEKIRLYYSKDEKKNMKFNMKRIVMYFRSTTGGNNNHYFSLPSTSPMMATMIFSSSAENVIQEEERTIIGLESSILPQIKLQSRRKMVRLVAKHQQWKLQHPSFFEEQFLAQNCRAISSSSRQSAIDRAQAVANELAREATNEVRRGSSCEAEPIVGVETARTAAKTTAPADEQEQDEDGDKISEAALLFCSVETILDASTGGTNLSVPSTNTATITVETIRMEAPSNACMVR